MKENFPASKQSALTTGLSDMVRVSVFSCPHCGESAEICEGVGSRDTLENIFYFEEEEEDELILKEYVSNAIFRKTMDLMADGYVPECDFGFKRYFCPICKTIEVRFFYRLEKDGKSWSPNFKCVKCRSQLILICGNHPPGSLRRRKEEECARYIRCPHCDGLIDTHTK